ncbi:MAG: MmcQ/YjbR family DNA-binding protein [Ruminococcus sp.]|nr:MmcQ/YjbR family DNA-binding protein [Ruminococcus sp.]
MSIPIHQKLDKYVKNKYGITPEILPFSHENYEIYRHTDTGKWFAVFIEKERSAFGLDGDGRTEIVCFKLKDSLLADLLAQQKGYLRGYPAANWSWLSTVLDGTVPYEDICRLLDESYEATKTKTKNKKTPLPKKK